ncbi:MAG: hypothetical protein IIU80_05710 [Clostridia bacterium]|nr:hypothetical protein [Clostridia bacterium]
MKISKKFLSFILSAIITATTFFAVGPVFSVKADAAITINGITQADIDITKYDNNRKNFFGGENTNWPTEFVLPGLDYPLTPQSVTYWEKRDWVLVSARNTQGSSHYIFALDAKSADFVALFKIWGPTGVYDYLACDDFSIAASDHNLYLISSRSSSISYFPLTEMDITLNSNSGLNKKDIGITGSINFSDEFNNAQLAYCSVDDGVLWVGNCYGTTYPTKAYNDTYPSALMGYQLKGSSSSEEWNNLKSGEGKKNCAGNPTYCVLFKNNLTNIQHASVNNGKIYILRSDSQLVSGGSTRSFEIADIDINAPGGTQLQINGITKDCHIIGDSLNTYSGTKVPENGEAFCIIEDYLYMFGVQKYGESISNAPIHVLWKVDQHKLNGVTRPDADADVKASHYEKVDNLSELTSGEEYIIAYKSENKDPVTQKEIFYLLDSFGGYGGKRLPKNNTPDGGSNTGDSLGTIGYALGDYTTDGDKLYISDTVDARKSIRWKISHSNGSNLRLENANFYYGNYKYLGFDYRHIAMMTDASNYLSNMKISFAGNSNFKLSYGNYYLWCNDNEYPAITEKYTEYYQSNKPVGYTTVYCDLEELPGTFHTDGNYNYFSQGGNKTGASVNDKLMQFEIYKRVKDPYASAEGTNIRTAYDVKLNANGLYDITMESYATAPVPQYTKLPDNTSKPTDFIFVMDTSTSMSGQFNKYSIRPSDEKFQIDYLVEESDLNNKNIGDYLINLEDGPNEEYIKASDGTYHPLRMALKRVSGSYRFLFWLYYVRDGQYYVFNNNGTIKYSRGWTESEFLNAVKNASETSESATVRSYTDVSGGSNKGILGSGWTGIFPFYIVWSENSSTYTNDEGRICAAKQFLRNTVDRISADNTKHRIAMCQFTGTPGNTSGSGTGAYTGFFTTYDSNRITISSGYNSDNSNYRYAFHSNSYFYNIKNILTKFDANQIGDGFGYGGGSDLSYGMYMAYKMLEASGENYTAYGDRHACVIVVTDGGVTTDDSQHNINFAKSSANSSIINSAKIKALGASIYTVRVGNQDISDFDENAFLDYLSSNYIYAKDLDNVGQRNSTGGDYTYELTVNPDTDWSFSETLVKDDKTNLKHSFYNLDSSAVVKESFDTNLFKYVEGQSSVEAKKVKAYYDALDRLSFDYATSENADVLSINPSNGEVTVGGFDYSKHYINDATALYNGNAKKFIITIKNLSIQSDYYANNADPTSNYIDVHVGNHYQKGIFAHQSCINSNDVYKGFPSDRIRIPQYTYVLDYGLPMSDPYVNGTVIAVDTQLRQQISANPFLPNELDIGVNGMFTGASGNTELLYTVRPSADGSTDSYALIQRPNGDYDWFKLNIIPASNVHFEESAFSASNTANTDWTSNGSSVNTYQELHSQSDIYGKDRGYESSTSSYSNGTNYSVTLSADQKRSETLSMTFTGTGFELYGACGANTGVQVINVKKDGKTVKAAVVDTFYKDTQNYGMLYQTPIYNVSGLTYGTYTVEVTAAYLPSISGAVQQIDDDEIPSSVNPELADALLELGFDEILETDDVDIEWFDDNSVLNGGTGAIDTESFSTQGVTQLVNYVDAIRIFEPAADGDKYYIESEKNARYYNINDNLMSASDYITGGSGFVYVEGNGEFGFSATDYNKKGSKHELYLSSKSQGDNALTFKVKDYGANSRVMLSLRAAFGTPVVKIGGHSLSVNSKTEMYYDITDYIASDGTVTIENAAESSLLSVGYVKVTGDANLQAASDLSTTIDMIEAPIEGEITASGSITNIEYTPSTDSHNSFKVTVNGRPTMIQFIEEDGGTRTYDRNSKNVVIKSYNADGVEVNSLDRTVAYEVWTISTNLTGPQVRVRAKYLVDGAYKWEQNCYSFTYEILEPEYDAEIREITPAAASGKKGAVSVKMVTGPDAQGIRFVMPDGSTCTYYSTKAVQLENGYLEFTGNAWMNENGENLIRVYVRENGKWIEAGEINYTAE